MRLLLAVLLVVAGAWIVVEPVRLARRPGGHRLSFSRMLMRLVSAGCVAAMGLLVGLSRWALAGRSQLADLLYWLTALVLAILLGCAGFMDWQLVRWEYLREQKRLLAEMARQEGDAAREP